MSPSKFCGVKPVVLPFCQKNQIPLNLVFLLTFGLLEIFPLGENSSKKGALFQYLG